MSFILESLQRVQRDQRKGHAPNLGEIYGDGSILPRRKRRWPWVIALVLVVSGGAAGYLLWPKSPGPDVASTPPPEIKAAVTPTAASPSPEALAKKAAPKPFMASPASLAKKAAPKPFMASPASLAKKAAPKPPMASPASLAKKAAPKPPMTGPAAMAKEVTPKPPMTGPAAMAKEVMPKVVASQPPPSQPEKAETRVLPPSTPAVSATPEIPLNQPTSHRIRDFSMPPAEESFPEPAIAGQGPEGLKNARPLAREAKVTRPTPSTADARPIKLDPEGAEEDLSAADNGLPKVAVERTTEPVNRPVTQKPDKRSQVVEAAEDDSLDRVPRDTDAAGSLPFKKETVEVPTKSPAPLPAVVKKAQPEIDLEGIPLVRDLPADIRDPLLDLTINVHGYFEDPDRRVVFINMRRYRVGEQIGDEKYVIEAITPEGVVINYGEGRARLLVKR